MNASKRISLWLYYNPAFRTLTRKTNVAVLLLWAIGYLVIVPLAAETSVDSWMATAIKPLMLPPLLDQYQMLGTGSPRSRIALLLDHILVPATLIPLAYVNIRGFWQVFHRDAQSEIGYSELTNFAVFTVVAACVIGLVLLSWHLFAQRSVIWGLWPLRLFLVVAFVVFVALSAGAVPVVLIPAKPITHAQNTSSSAWRALHPPHSNTSFLGLARVHRGSFGRAEVEFSRLVLPKTGDLNLWLTSDALSQPENGNWMSLGVLDRDKSRQIYTVPARTDLRLYRFIAISADDPSRLVAVAPLAAGVVAEVDFHEERAKPEA